MKLHKTRIKKITKSSGQVIYIAQYKGWINWHNFDSWHGDVWHIYCAWIKDKEKLDGSKEEAKSLIDYYIKIKTEIQAIKENKIIKIEYEDYP